MSSRTTALIALSSGLLLAGCGGSSTANNAMNKVTNAANSVVNTMNTNAEPMPGANNNTGYVMNSNQTSPPTMPRNATNISPPSMTNSKNMNAHSNTSNVNKK